jgi:hypothetical protein
MSETITVKEIGSWVERGSDALECECGGYAERATPTAAEDKKYGCGRPRCCTRAFVCKICGTRWVGQAAAPEMD